MICAHLVYTVYTVTNCTVKIRCLNMNIYNVQCCRELKKRKSYCWSNYKYTVGVFANTIYSIDRSKYLKEPILKIMLIYKSLLWILNKIQVQNAATSCIRLMGKNIFFLTGMEEIFKLKPFTNSIL